MNEKQVIGVATETFTGERRVAATPDTVRKLVQLGYGVQVQAGCGSASHFSDDQYVASGADLVPQASTIWTTSDLVLAVRPPNRETIGQCKSESTWIGFVWPAQNAELLQEFCQRRMNALAMDCVPRITRAQKMDALSSMANIAGYRAVVEAATAYGSFFTGQITAAGNVPPATVLVIGAGVAGLAAIAAARGLGAVVRAFDTRPAAREQVLSMGAEFLELELEESGEGHGGYAKEMSPEFIRAEMELFARQARQVDIIITTALIPGKPAPRLITAEMVRSMRQGSVIVDLAAEQGGNCELTERDRVVVQHGVTIIGYTDLPSRLPTQASRLYANNVVALVEAITPQHDGVARLDLEVAVIRGALVAHQGAVTWPPPPEVTATPSVPTASGSAPSLAMAKSPSSEAARPAHVMGPPKKRHSPLWIVAGVTALLLLLVGWAAPPDFIRNLTVFALACFVGWHLIWNVTPALHTPLMSVTNAISGIIVIGAMLQLVGQWYYASALLAFVAVLIAAINVAGGFLVTQRMLGMFRKQE